MTRQQFTDIALAYHVNPETIGCHWDGSQFTFFSLEYGDNQIIANRDPCEMWEFVICMGKQVATRFISTEMLQDYIIKCLKVWDNKGTKDASSETS
jgi:hypothetical protein